MTEQDPPDEPVESQRETLDWSPRPATGAASKQSVQRYAETILGSSPSIQLTPQEPGAPADQAVTIERSHGAYRFIEEIAEGGMGRVLRCSDPELRRDVALKVVKSKLSRHPAVLQRFIEEAQIGGQLQHPGIVPIYEIGMAGDMPYFAMKLIEGQALVDLLEDRPDLSSGLHRYLGVFASICQAMAYAHSRGVVHRDLKPSNVMVGAFGEVQIVDWGLAKVLGGPAVERALPDTGSGEGSKVSTLRDDPDSHGTHSIAGGAVGTPGYMPPEQASGDLNAVDRRSDVFALGGILCEILTGFPPYRGGKQSPLQEATLGLQEDLHERLAASQADAEVVDLARRCLALDPAERPADAKAVADAIEGYLSSVEERAQAAVIAVAEERARAASERKARWLTSLLAGVIILAALGAAGAGFWMRQQAEERADELRRRVEAMALYRQGIDQAARATKMTDAALREAGNDRTELLLGQAIATDQTLAEAHFALAQLYARRDDDRAIASYRTADQFAREQGGAGDARALIYAGDHARLVMADLELAAELYQAASAAEPNSPHALVGLGYVALLEGDFGTALQRGEQAAELDPALWEPHFLQGTVRARDLTDDGSGSNPLHDPELAVAHLDDTLRRNRDHVPAYNERGTAYLSLEKLAQAERDFLRVQELQPDSTVHAQNLAIVAQMRGDHEEALRLLDGVLERRPEAPLAWSEKGTALWSLGRNEEAVAALERSLELRPNRPIALTSLAAALRSSGRLEDAVARARQATELAPEIAVGWMQLALALELMGEMEASLEAVERALEAEPGKPIAWSQHARLLVRLDRPADARLDAQALLAEHPEHAAGWVALGQAEFQLGNGEPARAAFAQAVELQESNFEGRLNLGITLRMLGQAEAALPHLERATEVGANDAKAWYQLGLLRQILRQPEAALAAYARGLEVDPRHRDTLINSAVLKNALGAHEGARDAAQLAAEVDASSVLAWVQVCVSEMGLDNDEAASAAIDRAVGLPAGRAVVRADVAAMLHDLGRYEECIPVAREAAAMPGAGMRPWTIITSAEEKLGNPEKVVEAYREAAAALAPGTVPLVKLAGWHYDRHEYEETLAVAREVLAVDAGSSSGSTYEAHALLGLGQHAAAVEAYLRVAAASPENAYPLVNAGVAAMKGSLLETAEEHLLAATKRQSDLAIAWELLGRVRLARGNPEGAREAYAVLGTLPDGKARAAELLEEVK